MVLLDSHQEEMVRRLTAAYDDEYPVALPVDVMSYANWAGANTTGQPLHMALSAVDPAASHALTVAAGGML